MIQKFNKNLKITSSLLKVLSQLIQQKGWGVLGDFKSVEKKFIEQGNKEEDVKKYLDLFKELKDKHRIAEEHRDIDVWGNKPFKDFQTFVDTLSETSSKTSVKKEPHKKHNIEGATFITENDEWIVYRIDTYIGSDLLGSRNWCTVRKKDVFESYAKNNTFYYILSKDKNKEDRWYKIALAMDFKGGKYFWDNNNKQHLSLPSTLNIPSFEMKCLVKKKLSDKWGDNDDYHENYALRASIKRSRK
jgi:hypothetical protein